MAFQYISTNFTKALGKRFDRRLIALQRYFRDCLKFNFWLMGQTGREMIIIGEDKRIYFDYQVLITEFTDPLLKELPLFLSSIERGLRVVFKATNFFINKMETGLMIDYVIDFKLLARIQLVFTFVEDGVSYRIVKRGHSHRIVLAFGLDFIKEKYAFICQNGKYERLKNAYLRDALRKNELVKEKTFFECYIDTINQTYSEVRRELAKQGKKNLPHYGLSKNKKRAIYERQKR